MGYEQGRKRKRVWDQAKFLAASDIDQLANLSKKRPQYLEDEEPTWQLVVSQEPSLDMPKAGKVMGLRNQCKNCERTGETEDG